MSKPTLGRYRDADSRLLTLLSYWKQQVAWWQKVPCAKHYRLTARDMVPPCGERVAREYQEAAP